MQTNDKIINRIDKSPLITIDLEAFYPKGERVTLDLADWLWEGLVLKEAIFRAKIKQHDWAQYKGKFVALFCSTDAIVPSWAYLLITLSLQEYAKYVVQGSLTKLEEIIFHEMILKLDLNPYRDKPVIIKGCRRLWIPENAYILLIQRLKPIVKSLMFGEACSTVQLYKRKKLKSV